MPRLPTSAWASPATAPPGACWSDSARARTTRARSPSTRVPRKRWYIGAAAAVAAIAVAVACGQGSGGSKNIISPEDAGVDAGPVGDAGPADAGDGGIDGGADAGPDAGPWHAGDVIMVPNSDGWHFSSDGLPSGSVMGASADEDGNIWVAGRGGGFGPRGGAGRLPQFTLAGGPPPPGHLPDRPPAPTTPRPARAPPTPL